ncbi:flippase [Exiguobacterium sp. SH1S21]|uniref:oligosaccharide flippase family protein n=1 Tax=Exiguobacterium sp. SH1S21 TaxID=2510953 RepID=UPI00103EDA84|nr:oligosaccharide flippase family protein [Exiguobacterium sp. SH1S21]TCI57446.1 flippase [Exiguobacterium sp. SH1S21]
MSQIKSGAILSYLSILVTIVVTLLFTPILIKYLGQEEYGLYAMVGSLAAYLSILDMGLGNAIVRYTARNRVIGDLDSEAKMNGFFLILYTVIGILTVVIGIVAYNTAEVAFKNNFSDAEISLVKMMIVIITITFSLSFPLSIFGAIMQAYEKFIVSKIVSIIRTIALPIISLPFLFLGYGALTVVVISSIINILLLIFNVYYCISNLNIKFRFSIIDSDVLKEILGYSFFIFLGIVVDQVNWNTGQIILGIFSNTIAIAVFAIAIQFIRLYLYFSTSISMLLLPKVSMMVANNVSSDELSKIMIKFGRIQFMILSFILCGFILFGHQFIKMWVGEDFAEAYYMVILIMVPITIPLIQNIGLIILQAKNLQKFRSVVLILIAIFNLILSLLLVNNYGGVGIAFSIGISYILGNSIVMNIYYYKKIKLNVLLFWKNIILLSIPIGSSLIGGFFINVFIASDSLLSILLKIFLFSVIYTSILWRFSLNSTEKKMIISILNSMLKIKNRFSNLLNKFKRENIK